MTEPSPKKPTLKVDYSVVGSSQSSSVTKTPIEEGKSSEAEGYVPTEPDPMEEKGLKIVHLSNECLEKIFHYLNLTDLTNSAEANVRLAAAAKNVFTQVHQNHRLFLKSRGQVIQIPEWHPPIDSDNFSLSPTVVENMFKHFGKYIRRIKVFHSIGGFNTTQNYNVAYQIAQHCSETLEELELIGATVFNAMRYLQKPFKRLHRLVCCEIITRLSPVDNLNELFPNLRTLELHNVFHVFESFRLEQHFPHMEHFAVFTFPYLKFDPTYIPIIRQIVNLNPQLRGISLYDMKSALNDFSLDTMPNIERLEIGGRLMFPRPPFDFGNVTSLRLIYSNENVSNSKEWRNLPPQLERLEVVGFKINDRSIAVIHQCRNLRSLTVMSFDEMDLKCVEQLAEKLHHIEEVEFMSKFNESSTITNAFSAALVFIQKCNTLRKATATIQIEKAEARYRINKWHYIKSKECSEAYREKLRKVLVFDWWRWSIRHHVRIIDFLKRWQIGPCFSASMINNCMQQ
ncbi:uncharacterized protein LOC129566943 [Sitodiplosis mosellana]|uniref:uncharacterized protein LOC129566943 n=1 Tax=Sitodiplosis mosellana TaxID=263140 RepID=UPI002444DAA7|nr:uncharacterized protein LOC129566943 [Sitodiplosis mosellana]